MEKIHVTKEGKKINLKDLSTSHLKNILSWIEKKAKHGILIRTGGGHDSDEMWYDSYSIYGQEVLCKLKYYNYLDELNNRNI